MSAFSSLSEFWQTMLPFIMLVEIVLEIGLFMYQLLRSNKPVLVFLVVLFFTADIVSAYQSGMVGFAAHIQ